MSSSGVGGGGENYYLETGFDPHGLKMSAIRNILTKHSVEYPSNAKKGELLGILKTKVLDQASKLRKEAKKLKRVKGDGHDIEVVVKQPVASTPSSSSVRTPVGTPVRPSSGTPIGGRTRARTPNPVSRVIPATGRSVESKPLESKPSESKPLESTRVVKSLESKAEAKSKPLESKSKAVEAKIEAKPKPVEAKPKPVEAKVEAKPKAFEAKPKASEAKAKLPESKVKLPEAKAKIPSESKHKLAKSKDKESRAALEDKKKTRKIKALPREVSESMDKAATAASRTGAKRKLSDAEDQQQQQAVDSGDEEFFTPAKPRVSPIRKHVTAHATPNFSDDNPFQSSPETAARKRRRLAAAAAAQQGDDTLAAAATTPLAALRKSQVSDLSFRVAMPRQQQQQQQQVPPPVAEVEEEAEVEDDLELLQQQLLQKRLDRDQEREREKEKEKSMPEPPPRFNLAGNAPSTRFTMTPDALRQMAADTRHTTHHNRRATTNQLPPVAPGLSRNAAGPRIAAAPRIATRRATDSDDGGGDSDGGDLQRRRLATVRRHSRQSSAASASASAEGLPLARPQAASPAPFKRTSSRRRGLLSSVALAAFAGLAAWHTHERWALGFGNARAELPLPEPAVPVGAADPDVIGQIRAWAAPQPLACPEHASCVVGEALPAWQAAGGARDRWAGVTCDAGHVIAFPPLAPRWVPLLPACVRDVSTELRVHALADALVAECAAHRGRVECSASWWVGGAAADQADQIAADEADEIERLGVSEGELRRRLNSGGMGAAEFDSLFGLAVEELEARRAGDVSHYVVEYEEEEGVEHGFFVARRAELPLACRVRRQALDCVLGHLREVVGALCAGVVGLVGWRRVLARRAERRAADALVGSALRRLKRQARRHYVDPALSPSPAIPSLQLRDLLLLSGGGGDTPPELMGGGSAAHPHAAYYDPRARAGVWERVRAVVERSANVRCRTTAVRGEPMRVWEWIGPLEDDSDEDNMFSPMTSPFASPQRMLSPVQ
ncbi:inner nuclear membrane protein enriched at telomere/subtelomere region [Coemansia aciculifera]|nr:inner nuclear membrane protein enriched at telomere/subtelomere region [Coemansia aciculifera]